MIDAEIKITWYRNEAPPEVMHQLELACKAMSPVEVTLDGYKFKAYVMHMEISYAITGTSAKYRISETSK